MLQSTNVTRMCKISLPLPTPHFTTKKTFLQYGLQPAPLTVLTMRTRMFQKNVFFPSVSLQNQIGRGFY